MEGDLGSAQASAPSLQRYFLPAHSSSASSLFSQALPQGLLPRHCWASQGSQQHSFQSLAPHHSAPAAFTGSSGSISHRSGQGQAPSLFPPTQSDRPQSRLFPSAQSEQQQRSSIFGQADQQQQQQRHPSPSLFASAPITPALQATEAPACLVRDCHKSSVVKVSSNKSSHLLMQASGWAPYPNTIPTINSLGRWAVWTSCDTTTRAHQGSKHQ